MDTPAIEANSLKKTFITKKGFWQVHTKTTLAVDDLTLTVNKGELFGLLGPNGAGKTTTIKMLTTLLLPTSGSISILGLDIRKNTREIRQKIGFTFGGARGLYGRLSARENLRYFAELYGLSPELAKRRIMDLLEMVKLRDRADDRVETFSSGMQQRLHLARALLHDPDLVFLDEPTVGIDPVGARELRTTVGNLVSMGKTVLLTTHYMAEAEELCDQIAIVNHGKIIAQGTPSSLKKMIGKESVIELSIRNDRYDEINSRLLQFKTTPKMKLKNELESSRMCIHTSDPENILRFLGPYLQSKTIQELEVRNQTLEDVYVALIQGKNHDPE